MRRAKGQTGKGQKGGKGQEQLHLAKMHARALCVCASPNTHISTQHDCER